MAETQSRLAIVVGGFISGLDLVRSLAGLDCRVIVITTQPHDVAQYSRHVSEHHHLDDLDQDPESLAVLLERHAADWKGAMILPTGDAAVAALAASHDRLASWFRLAIPPLESVPFLLDRLRMSEAAGKVGIALPRCYGTVSELAQERSRLDYPVVVKPVRSGEFVAKFGRKLLVARNASSLDSATRQLDLAGVEGQVFDLVPGPDSDIHGICLYMGPHGQPVAECTVRKLRQSPPAFGVARVAEIVGSVASLREQSVELLRHIGFRGFASVEFKYDRRDGSYRFFEINGRPVIYGALLRKGGLDVAGLTWAEHSRDRLRPVATTHWPGVWIHLHADLLRSLENWRREGLAARDYLGPYLRPKTYAVWSSSDTGPFRAQWSRTFRQACSAVVSRRGRVAAPGANC